MKKNYLLIVAAFTCFLGNVNAQSPDWQWAKGLGGTDADYGTSITTDAFGNVYTTGGFTGTVDFDPGPGVFNLTGGGGFISKSDNSGNFIWAKAIGGEGSSMVIDNGGSGDIYTTGGFTGTVDFDPGVGTFNLTAVGGVAGFISKLDSSGNFVWAKQISSINGGDAFGQSITIDASGSVYTTGSFRGAVDFNPGTGAFILSSSGGISWDIFISKLDSSGNFVLAKRMGGPETDGGSSIALDASGNIYTTGSFQETVDFNPGSGTFNLTSPGPTPFNESPPSDIFISKLDPTGNFVWAKQMGGSMNDYVMSITIDHGGSGAVYTTGFFSGTADFDPDTSVGNVFNLTGTGNFISKLDSSGNFVWAKRQGGGAFRTLRTSGYSIATDHFGNVYATGTFVGTADFDPGADTFNLTSAGGLDIFISKLNSSGNFVWAKAISGTDNGGGWSLALDASGDVYTIGEFRGTADFDPGSGVFNLTSTGGIFSDIFISKLNGSGNFVWAKAVGGTGYDYGRSIAIDASGSVHVSGYFRSPSISFDSINLINAGANNTYDLFIARLDATVVTGTNEIENFDNRILLFPNPATNHLTIALESNNKNVEVTIFDITGKIIYATTGIATQQIEVNTKDFAEGIYFVQIQTADFIETKKLVVEK